MHLTYAGTEGLDFECLCIHCLMKADSTDWQGLTY